jgi:hypothetical protein
VQDVVLGDQADAVPEFGVVGVEIAVVVEHGAFGGRAHAGQGAEQGGLAGAARSDDAEQATLAEGEADVVEEDLAVRSVREANAEAAW